jgi:hypothetical protein
MSPKHDRSMPSASAKSDASSAMAPLLSDMEVEATVEEETSPAVNDANNKQERKAFSTAEYKIAFSHFLVRKEQSVFQAVLTYLPEDFLILDQT